MSKQNGTFTPEEWERATRQALELGGRALAAEEKMVAEHQTVEPPTRIEHSQNGTGTPKSAQK